MTPQRDQPTSTPCPSRRHHKRHLSPIATLPIATLEKNPIQSLGPSRRRLSAPQAATLSRQSPIRDQKKTASRSLRPSHRNREHRRMSAHQATLSHISSMRVGSDNSDQSIDQISQEIQTLERIANRLNHLYSLRDKFVRRGDSHS